MRLNWFVLTKLYVLYKTFFFIYCFICVVITLPSLTNIFKHYAEILKHRQVIEILSIQHKHPVFVFSGVKYRLNYMQEDIEHFQ